MRSSRNPPIGRQTNSELVSDDPNGVAPERGRKTVASSRIFWLHRAVDATLLANSMPTAKLKSEVAHLATRFLKLAETDAAPVRLRKRRGKQRRGEGLGRKSSHQRP